MLKFHAKPGGLTAWPNSAVGNQARRYVGRVFTRTGDVVSYPAAAEPSEVKDDDADASHLIRKCSRGELWAADEHTARVCGVAFVALERGAEGEWFPAVKKTPPKPDKAASKE